jgi:hypothetical protein
MNMPDLATSNPILPGSAIIDLIKEALARDGTHTWDDVQEMLIVGAAQIFWNDHGAWITEIVVTPRKRSLHVWLIAGQLPEVMELQEQAERFCLTNTLERMTSTARPGWTALAAKDGWEKFGWRKYADAMSREITGV